LATKSDLSSTEQRISEVAERLRAEARARLAQTQSVPTFRSAHVAESVRMHQPEPAPAPQVHLDLPRHEHGPAQAMIRDDVVLTPTQPKQAVAYDPPMPAPAHHEEPLQDAAFIPPQPDRAVLRPARMPRVEELPVPAQNQIRASRGDAEAGQDHKRMTLLQRLATVGFGRKDEAGPVHAPVEAPVPPQRQPEPPRQPASSVHAEYARRPPPPQGYRPAQGQLDAQGRMPQHPRSAEDDQLEIPAFLRRAN
jgi:cell division protein FtsZ